MAEHSRQSQGTVRGRGELAHAEAGLRVLAWVLWGGQGPPEWLDRAACAGSEWPADERSVGRRERARQVCIGCPVRRECLAYFVKWETQTGTRAWDAVGVAGGLTAAERRSLYLAMRGSGVAKDTHM